MANASVTCNICDEKIRTPDMVPIWIVYPPPQHPTKYKPGDTVFLRPKSAKEVGRIGTVTAVPPIPNDENNNDEKDRRGKDCSTTSSRTAEKIHVRFPILPRSHSRKRRRCEDTATVVDPQRVVDGCQSESSSVSVARDSPDGVAGGCDDRRADAVTDAAPPGGARLWYDADVRPGRLVPRYSAVPATTTSECDRGTISKTASTVVDGIASTKDVESPSPPPLAKPSPAAATTSITIVTERTDQYRILASSQISPDDHVLEIGCSNGECSRIIARNLLHNIAAGGTAAGSLVGFDTSSSMIAEARDKVKTVLRQHFVKEKDGGVEEGGGNDDDDVAEFHKIDPFTDPKNALHLACGTRSTGHPLPPTDHRQRRCPNVVLIDIGGNRDLASVLRMVSWARNSFSPRLVIIKSEEMAAAMVSSKAATTAELAVVGRMGTVPDGEERFGRLLRTESTRRNVDTEDRVVVHRNGNHDETIGSGRGGVIPPTNDATSPSLIVRKASLPPRYRHPLRAPMALVPLSLMNNKNNNNNNGGLVKQIPICRYHNYHDQGCRKGDQCPYNHTVCHWCLTPGHIALECGRSRVA